MKPFFVIVVSFIVLSFVLIFKSFAQFSPMPMVISNGQGTVSQSITSVALSNTTFAPSTANAVVGTVIVTTSPASPAFSGTLTIGGTNSEGFHLAGACHTGPDCTLQAPSGGLATGSYTDVTVVASGAYTNSPQQITPNPTLTATSTTVSVCNNPTPPSPANAAGFTTLAGCWDFTQNTSTNVVNPMNGGTQTMNWATLSNWLDCAGASSPQWWKAGWSVGPCADYTVASDSGGGAAQALILTAHPYPADPYGCATSPCQLNQTPQLSAVTQDFTHGMAIPVSNMYLEGKMRSDVTAGQAASGGSYGGGYLPLLDFYTFYCTACTQTGSVEIDCCEYFLNDAGTYGSNVVMTAPGGGVAAAQADNNYHQYGVLLTSNRTTLVGACSYVDNAAPPGAPNCIDISNKYSGSSFTEIGNIFLNNAANLLITGSATPVNLNNAVSVYFLWVRAWTCSGWNSSHSGAQPLTTVNTCSVASPFRSGTPP